MSISNDSSVTMSKDNFGHDGLGDGQLYGEGDGMVGGYEHSPYADAEILCLHIGPDATPYSIHATILAQSPPLIKKFDDRHGTKQRVNIPELDDATAHTLINYLYTQKYESLRLPQVIQSSSTADNKIPNPTTITSSSPSLPSYTLSTRTYSAASTYLLPGLASLAKERITSLGEDIDIFDILDIARDYGFPGLPESDEWYSQYLEGVIKGALEEDAERFRGPEVLGRVSGCKRLMGVVWEVVLRGVGGSGAGGTPRVEGLGSTAVEKKDEREHEPVVEVEREDEEQTTETASEIDVSVSAQMSGSVVTSELSIAQLEQEVASSKTSEAEERSLKLDDMDPIEPILEVPSGPERATDEIDFKTSKMSQQWGKKLDQSPVREKVVVKLPERPKHARTDSVMQAEEQKFDVLTPVENVKEKSDDEEKNVTEAVDNVEPVVSEVEAAILVDDVVATKDEVKDVAAPPPVSGSSVEAGEAPVVAKKDKKKSKKKKNPTTF